MTINRYREEEVSDDDDDDALHEAVGEEKARGRGRAGRWRARGGDEEEEGEEEWEQDDLDFIDDGSDEESSDESEEEDDEEGAAPPKSSHLPKSIRTASMEVCISAAPPLHLPRTSPASPPHLPCSIQLLCQPPAAVSASSCCVSLQLAAVSGSRAC